MFYKHSISIMYIRVDKEKIFCGKTVSRNHANKNTPHKNNDFMLFSVITSIENTTKNAIQIPCEWSDSGFRQGYY